MANYIWKCRDCGAEFPESGYGLHESPNSNGQLTLYCFCSGVVDLVIEQEVYEEKETG